MGDKVIRTGLCADGNERMKRLFRLLAVGRIDPTPLTTNRFRFDELGRVLQLMETRRGFSSPSSLSETDNKEYVMVINVHNPKPSVAGREGHSDRAATKVYLVGGGIASLAAAVFLIRDGNVLGRNITVLEELEKLGGSLDGAGSPRDGYVLRGGRMIESKYLCTYRPVLVDPDPRREQDGHAGDLRLERDHEDLVPVPPVPRRTSIGRPQVRPRRETHPGPGAIGDRTRGDAQAGAASRTSSIPRSSRRISGTCGARPSPSRPGTARSSSSAIYCGSRTWWTGSTGCVGSCATVYNQYDSMVRPLQKWLDERGVRFELNTRVTDLGLSENAGEKRVERIVYERGGRPGEIAVGPEDYVIVTLGSMTEASSLGSMDSAPTLNGKADGGAWTLWEKIADGRPEFGCPSTFEDHIDESKWMSFTTTQHDPSFFRIVRDATGNVPGEGGLVTFVDSAWLMSIVLPHQPHFIGQPDDVKVFWGYGLFVDKPGDFVKKAMSACSGREIMTELLGHFRVEAEASRILETSICIPCMMPFITSQFLRRERGDRPQVVPEGSTNLAFVGQFCEIPDDVVFTVEYSVRSAQTAVYSLLGLNREPPAVYKGQYDPRVLYRAFMTLHDIDT